MQGPCDKTIKIDLKYVYPDGTESNETRGLCSPGADCFYFKGGIWLDPSKGATGKFYVKFYDEKGNMLGESSVNITG